MVAFLLKNPPPLPESEKLPRRDDETLLESETGPGEYIPSSPLTKSVSIFKDVSEALLCVLEWCPPPKYVGIEFVWPLLCCWLGGGGVAMCEVTDMGEEDPDP